MNDMTYPTMAGIKELSTANKVAIIKELNKSLRNAEPQINCLLSSYVLNSEWDLSGSLLLEYTNLGEITLGSLSTPVKAFWWVSGLKRLSTTEVKLQIIDVTGSLSNFHADIHMSESLKKSMAIKTGNTASTQIPQWRKSNILTGSKCAINMATSVIGSLTGSII